MDMDNQLHNTFSSTSLYLEENIHNHTWKRNPALLPFVLYLGAWYINDLLSISLGSISITINQLVVIYGILHIIRLPYKMEGSPIFKKIAFFLFLYNISVLVSLAHSVFVFQYINLNVISVFMNSWWFFTVGRYLSLGLTSEDWKLIQKIFLVGTLVILMTGVAEYLYGDNLLETSYGTLSGQFWIRGLHIDKVDYASSAIAGVLLLWGISQSSRTPDRKIRNLLGLVILIFLIILSRSWTGYTGLIISLFLYFMSSKAKKVPFIISVVVFISIIAFLLPQSQFYEDLYSANDLKFSLQIEDINNNNFRYKVFVISNEYFLTTPLLGAGFGRSADVVKEIMNDPDAPLPHNALSTVMVEQGIVGLIPFLLLVFSIIGVWFSALKTKNLSPAIPNGIQVFLIGFAGLVFARFVLYYFYLSLSIYYIWAVLLIASQTNHRETENQ